MPVDFAIRDACIKTGLSPRTIRYYEELGLLPGVRRREGGRRVYGPAETERLAFIGRLKKLGLSLAEIKELNAVYAIAGCTRSMLERLDELLEQHLGQLGDRIAELVSLRDEMSKYRDHIANRIEVLPVGGRAEATARPGSGPSARTEGSK
jgi:MerR family copper efflux transcriptional regulator